MTKIIFRFLIMFFVTILAGLGVFAVVKGFPGIFIPNGSERSMGMHNMPGPDSQRFDPNLEPNNSMPHQGSPGDFRPGEGRGQRGGFGRGRHGEQAGEFRTGSWIFGMLKNISIIAFITMAVLLVKKLTNIFARRLSTPSV